MFDIEIYEDKNGKSEVKDYISRLQSKKTKDSNIKFNKIISYIRMLKTHGLSIGEPYIKHISNDIWELRPLRDRILFAAWNGDGFVLLHQFMKQTQKTPPREIEKAERELEDYRKRSIDHE